MRSAQIEEVEEEVSQRYYEDPQGEDTLAQLAARTVNLPEQDKEAFLAELKALDVNF